MRYCAQMAATEVVQIIAWLEAAGVIYQINGGWGVDGLVGRQTLPSTPDLLYATPFPLPPPFASVSRKNYYNIAYV